MNVVFTSRDTSILTLVGVLLAGCASDPGLSSTGQEAAFRAPNGADGSPPACEANAPVCPAACQPKTCQTVAPTNPLLTDWRDVATGGMFVDNDSCSHPSDHWWEAFYGGPYVYPAVDACSGAATPEFPLVQSIDGTWHVTGTVGTWSGFGLWFAPCMVDLSAYRGLELAIGGDVGTSGRLRLDVLTSSNSKPDKCLTNVGTCDPAQGECQAAHTALAVPEHPAPVRVLWSELQGGSPVDGVDPREVIGIHLAFERVEWGAQVTPPFPVDVRVARIKLVE